MNLILLMLRDFCPAMYYCTVHASSAHMNTTTSGVVPGGAVALIVALIVVVPTECSWDIKGITI
jgi:hypothetical protein